MQRRQEAWASGRVTGAPEVRKREEFFQNAAWGVTRTLAWTWVWGWGITGGLVLWSRMSEVARV